MIFLPLGENKPQRSQNELLLVPYHGKAQKSLWDQGKVETIHWKIKIPEIASFSIILFILSFVITAKETKVQQINVQ